MSTVASHLAEAEYDLYKITEQLDHAAARTRSKRVKREMDRAFDLLEKARLEVAVKLSEDELIVKPGDATGRARKTYAACQEAS